MKHGFAMFGMVLWPASYPVSCLPTGEQAVPASTTFAVVSGFCDPICSLYKHCEGLPDCAHSVSNSQFMAYTVLT